MRVLFVTKPHLPLVGGAQVTEHHLALALRDRGHEVAVLCPTDPVRRPVLGLEGIDRSPGYRTIKSPDVPEALRSDRLGIAPDVAIVGANRESVRERTDRVLAALAGVPAVLYLHDVASAALADRPVARVLACSRFVAGAAPPSSAVEVLPPIVDPRRYAVPTSGRVALFVNPVPKKGLALALEIAERNPAIPFAFTRCWWIAPDEDRSLRAEVRRLPNVELRDAVTDPAELYGDARVLLVPSACAEGFGRVAREAQCSGIPVIARRVGGLPEAVGQGGVLLDPIADAAAWSAELARLWDDGGHYARLSALALRQADDGSCASERVGARLEAILRGVVAGSARLVA